MESSKALKCSREFSFFWQCWFRTLLLCRLLIKRLPCTRQWKGDLPKDMNTFTNQNPWRNVQCTSLQLERRKKPRIFTAFKRMIFWRWLTRLHMFRLVGRIEGDGGSRPILSDAFLPNWSREANGSTERDCLCNSPLLQMSFPSV